MVEDKTTSRIAKNTLALYIRSFVTMLLLLYTSRLTLQLLGVNDYGVYNVVGAVVVFFAVLDNAMSAAYQRFLNFEMGQGSADIVNRVFCTSVTIQIVIAISLFVISEIVGLYLLYNHLVIPEGRMVAAFWVFQFSVITLVVNILIIPYNALIVAKEKMTAFAYIDVVNTLLKLIVVVVLFYIEWDRLIMYGFFLMLIQLLTCLLYLFYCTKNFKESKYRFIWSKVIAYKMLSFSLWTAISSIAYMIMMQGLAMLYNIYYGIVASAAIGIGNQVMLSVRKLAGNLAISFAPQIVKRYSIGDYENVSLIWDIGSKATVFLFAVFAVPLILNIDYILGLWLTTVPQYAAGFSCILLLENLVRCLAGNASTIVRATGNIVKYELIINCIRIVTFAFIFISFVFICNIYAPYIVYFLHTIIEVVYSAYVGCECIYYSRTKYYLNNCLLILVTLAICFLIPMYLCHEATSPLTLIFNVLVTIIVISIVFLFVGFLPGERKVICKKMSNLKSFIN
jgi:O-antigen/teichoic acid export membrane protein